MQIKRMSTFKIALIGIFTALTFVVTITIRVPMIGTNGYVNIGDAIIYITAAVLGPIPALLAGGIGSCIADLIGYPIWAPFTLIIKGLEGFIVGILLKLLLKKGGSIWKNILGGLISMIVSAVFMIIMYFFAGWILSGLGGAIQSIVGNIFQGGISIVIAMVAIFVFQLPKIAERFLNKTSPHNSEPPNTN